MKKKILMQCLLLWIGPAGLFLSPVLAQKAALQEGRWRGVFTIGTEEVPFQLDISATAEGYDAVAVNGDRRDTFGVRHLSGDSVLVSLHTFESALFARVVTPELLTGEYRVLEAGETVRSFPVRLEFGKDYRFIPREDLPAARADLTGKWRLKLTNRAGEADRIAVLTQEGARLKGIILSVTGDSRDLQGEVAGNRFYLSGFTGSGPVLVTGEISDGGVLRGESGTVTKTVFEGRRDENAALPDAYALTFLKPGRERLRLELPDLNGKMVHLEDPKYRGKVVIVEIMGSWCPNCLDQIAFLSPWFNANRHRGVEIVSVAFEAKDDIGYAKRMLDRLRERFDIRYDILFGGKADAGVVAERFDDLNTFLAFPTTIIIGRDGKVRSIHTGFSGEGTGAFYQEYIKKFNRDMDKYLAEPAP